MADVMAGSPPHRTVCPQATDSAQAGGVGLGYCRRRTRGAEQLRGRYVGRQWRRRKLRSRLGVDAVVGGVTGMPGSLGLGFILLGVLSDGTYALSETLLPAHLDVGGG